MCCWVSTIALNLLVQLLNYTSIFYSLSATCVHVSAILHALVSITSSSQPNPSSVVNVENESDTVVSPTSLLNSWKPPRKRKESTMMMSQAKFEKHVYGKEKQYDIQSLEMFDPRPTEYRGTATNFLKKFIETTKGRCSCVSLLFDEATQVWKRQLPSTNEKSLVPTEYNICSKSMIEREVTAFKESLKIDEAGINAIERETREQTKCHNWYHMRRLRLTASHFGEIL